jgi:hypothetical protein
MHIYKTNIYIYMCVCVFHAQGPPLPYTDDHGTPSLAM